MRIGRQHSGRAVIRAEAGDHDVANPIRSLLRDRGFGSVAACFTRHRRLCQAIEPSTAVLGSACHRLPVDAWVLLRSVGRVVGLPATKAGAHGSFI